VIGDRGIDVAISHYSRAKYNGVLSGELRERVSARLRYDAAVNGFSSSIASRHK
jgi:hypothetical protein